MLIDIVEHLKHLAITAVATRHDEVTPGSVYFAIKGQNHNGEDYIPQAIASGAVCIVRDGSQYSKYAIENKITCFTTPNLRQDLAKVSKALYILQPEYVVAVTGTNGKTSTAHYYYQICHILGKTSAYIGTVGAESTQSTAYTIPAGITTPEPPLFYQILHQMAQDGVTHLAIEASSHGLDQQRIAATTISAAAFTNLTHDHLDYHHNFDHYLQAKLKLFREILPYGPCYTAVLNNNIPEIKILREIAHEKDNRVIIYGSDPNCDVQYLAYQKEDLQIRILDRVFTLSNMPWLVDFHIANLMCAIGLVLATVPGLDIALIAEAASKVKPVAGRMEFIGTYQEASIYVDYAATPDSLKKALIAVRSKIKRGGKLHLVFGCGGDRDQTKRPIMGAIASELADHVIITDDNPRYEDASSIRSMILKNCPTAQECEDRALAIRTAIDVLKPNDLLLIAGKGHENYQIINGQYLPHHDATVVQKIISEKN